MGMGVVLPDTDGMDVLIVWLGEERGEEPGPWVWEKL